MFLYLPTLSLFVVYPISKRIAWFFLSRVIKEIKGLENIPPPPAILACNHESDIDGPLMHFFLLKHKNKKVCSIVTDERVDNFFGDFLVKHFEAARVNSGAVKKAYKALKEEKYVLIFPEGQRTFNGKIQKVSHTGLGVLAVISKAPVVPVKIRSYKFWSRHTCFPNLKNKITINIGKPKVFKGKIKTGRVNKQDAKKVIEKVMRSIKALK